MENDVRRGQHVLWQPSLHTDRSDVALVLNSYNDHLSLLIFDTETGRQHFRMGVPNKANPKLQTTKHDVIVKTGVWSHLESPPKPQPTVQSQSKSEEKPQKAPVSKA